MRDGSNAPTHQGEGKNQIHADQIQKAPAEELPAGVGEREGGIDARVIDVSDVVGLLQIRREDPHDHAIQVVYGGGEEEEEQDYPAKFRHWRRINLSFGSRAKLAIGAAFEKENR